MRTHSQKAFTKSESYIDSIGCNDITLFYPGHPAPHLHHQHHHHHQIKKHHSATLPSIAILIFCRHVCTIQDHWGTINIVHDDYPVQIQKQI